MSDDAPSTGDSLPRIIAEPAPPLTSARPAPTGMTLGHWILLVSFTTVYLALFRGAQVVGVMGAALAIAQAVAAGAEWTGLAILISRLIRGVSTRIHPGHWLLAVLGARLALEVLLYLQFQNAVASPETLLATVTACLLLPAALSGRQELRWRIFFWLLIAIHLAGLLLIAQEWQGALAVFWRWRVAWLAALVVIWAVLDRRAWRERDWLHWLGLAVPLWLLGIVLAERLL